MYYNMLNSLTTKISLSKKKITDILRQNIEKHCVESSNLIDYFDQTLTSTLLFLLNGSNSLKVFANNSNIHFLV